LTKAIPYDIIKKNKRGRQMGKKKKKEINKQAFKMDGEELQQYLHFKKRGSVVENKKGKGSYKRHEKHKGKSFE
jgi:stalled ribosome alternative rescue factor ArfA